MATKPQGLTLKRDTTTALPLINSAPRPRAAVRREALNPSRVSAQRRESLNPKPQRNDAVQKTRKAEAEVRTPAAENKPRPRETAQASAPAPNAQTGKKIDVFA